MTADEIVLLTTDPDLTVVGDPITHWTSVDAVQRFNQPGTGQFVCPAERPLLDLLAGVAPGGEWVPDQIETGYRIVMLRGGEIWLAGPIETWTYEEDDDQAAGGLLTVTWSDDSAWLGARVTYPDPTSDAESQIAASHYSIEDDAETVIRTLVDVNAGPSALAARRVPKLALGALAGVGSAVKWSTRFEPVATDIAAVAVAGGGLGYRVVQDSGQLLFEVYEPPDMTNTVRFSRGLGNLRSARLTVTAPAVTSALVGGAGTGTDRPIYEQTDSDAETAWGRYERFVNQSGTDDQTELLQAGTAELARDGERARLETVTVDTADLMYGRDYPLGARASVEVWPGREIADVVREAHLTASEEGVRVQVTVGSGEDVSDPAWVRRLRDLDRRVTRMEVG